MNVTNVTYRILAADAGVSAAVGTRIYIIESPQGTPNPHIVYRASLENETFSKSGVSLVDTWRVELDIYHATFALASSVAQLVRSALDGYQGTIGDATVQGCKFEDARPDKDVNDLPIWSMDFKMRVKN
jgi:hypothetical protein